MPKLGDRIIVPGTVVSSPDTLGRWGVHFDSPAQPFAWIDPAAITVTSSETEEEEQVIVPMQEATIEASKPAFEPLQAIPNGEAVTKPAVVIPLKTDTSDSSGDAKTD